MASYYGTPDASQNQNIITTASNIIDGTNPTYELTDFYASYPAYAPRTVNITTTYLVDPLVIQMYIDLATACVKQARYHSYWKNCMGWFVAHFVTLYLQSVTNANSTAAQVIAAGKAKGLATSKSVGDVSAGYDHGLIGNDLDGWCQWKLTIFGTQFASISKLLGRGGSYIW